MRTLILLLSVFGATVAFAQGAPVSSPVSLIGFVQAHVAAIALAVYAALDVLILVIPSLAGNGLVHQILILAGKLAGMQPPPPPPAA